MLAVQGSIGFAFLLFMVVASNPFARLNPVPIEGNGLNPVLQDPALAFHPPFLYAGYVGLSVAFSFAIAALIDGKVDAAWARWVRPWTLAAWMFLTIGISMGSWWAYYELGWGGWWFWDPVENASFMPWLVATALLHSAIVVEKRNALKVWTVLLSILAFSLSLLGTFLVRSGVLTSVHAFAVDPARGIFILGILCFFIGGALTLFAWRAPALKAGGFFSPISREGGLVLNNLFLCAACASVLIGTLYPLALETITGEKISVGPPYFNLTFGPIMLPLLLLVPIGALLSWKRADLFAVLQRLWAAAALAIGLGVLVLVATQRGPWLAPLGMALGAWLIFGSLADLANRIALFRAPLGSKPLAPCGPAALKPWHDLRSRRARPDDHRHHRHHPVEGGAYRGHEARRARRRGRLHGAVRGRNTAHRRKLHGPRRAVPDFPGRSRNRHRRLREARVQAHGNAHNRSGPASNPGRRCLCGDGRQDHRWRTGRAPVFQSAGVADLARRAHHVFWRSPVAHRPPLPRRRPKTKTHPRWSSGGMRWFLLFSLLLLTPAYAVQPDEILADPKLEQRARDLSTGFRCLVCQNQSIDESDAPLAKDLRILIREHLTKGDSDAEIRDFVVARYGEFVLLKPRLTAHTAILWATPFLIILAGFAVILRRRKISGVPAELALSAEEQKALREM